MQLTNKKVKVQEHGTELEITIPSEKNIIFPLFSFFWIGAWFFFYNYASHHESAFMKIWLVGWAFAGLFMIAILLWFFFGYEKLKVSTSEIVFSMSVFGIRRNKIMQKRDFKRCVFNKEGLDKQKARKDTTYLLNPGKIRVEYQNRSFSFGGGLEDREAEYLVGLINKKIEIVGK